MTFTAESMAQHVEFPAIEVKLDKKRHHISKSFSQWCERKIIEDKRIVAYATEFLKTPNIEYKIIDLQDRVILYAAADKNLLLQLQDDLLD